MCKDNQNFVICFVFIFFVVKPATQIRDYHASLKSPNEDKIEWDTLDNCSKLRLFWNAPQNFYGNIIYRVIDENNLNAPITGTISKLPIVLEMARNQTGRNPRNLVPQIFSKMPGKYNLSILTYLEVPSDLSNDGQSHVIESTEKSQLQIGE